jgi:cell wall-associated NlpC family hydrolase
VNRRHALFRLAALPGALGAAISARAQQTVEMPMVPFREPPISLTVTPTLESVPTPDSPPVGAPLRPGIEDLLFKALSLVGVRYRMGGSSPETGFDCSGYVCYLYREVFSMALPRTADGIGQRGQSIARSALQPGDLVFFNTMRRPFTHVGIYLGEDRFVHAPSTGGLVRTESLNERYWVKRWDGARRIQA